MAISMQDGTATDRVTRNIGVSAAVAAALYCAMLAMRPYPGEVILKSAMCVLLASIAWRERYRLFATALLFSAAGDALLAGDGERWFIPGLVAFLITQLLYAGIFWRDQRLLRTSLQGGRTLALVLIPLFAIVYATLLFPRLGASAVPVVIYMAAIVAMAILSLRVSAISVPVGAVMFMASDSLLALDKFVWSAAWLGPLIWITYAAAQLLIAYGLLAKSRIARPIPA